MDQGQQGMGNVPSTLALSFFILFLSTMHFVQ
jgi:hypothetical protein